MYVYRRLGLLFGESFFEPPDAPTRRVDIQRVSTTTVPADLTRARASSTLEIDLARDEDDLLNEMNKPTRYQVRRAIKSDGFEYVLDEVCSEDAIRTFADYYDRFAVLKGRRPIYRKRLSILAKHRMLALTSTRAANDIDALVRHSYVRSSTRVALLQSASLFRESQDSSERNRIGRANRYTHWKDIVAFKSEGIAIYDLGGLDTTDRSPETMRIAEFKRGFGGTVTTVYSITRGGSLLGRTALRLARAAHVDL